jgi:endonuclease/exonuclease/phosphatase family metal-dependent hydrolase
MHPSTRALARGRTAVAALVVATLAIVSSPAKAAVPLTGQERAETVVTFNVYLGANLQPLIGQSGPGLVQAAAAVFAHVAQTDFPARAQAIARLIAEERPVVVGLQEVALWQTAPIQHPEQAQTAYDFLGILLDALASVRTPYRAVVVNADFSAALPISTTTLGIFTDRNVILVPSDASGAKLKVANPTSQVFQARLPVPIGGGLVDITRGWATVDVRVRGASFRIADTHLEAFSEPIRNLQAQELAASLAASPIPVVLLGDLNSEPGDLAGAYGIMLGAGFVDGWVEAMDGTPGYTAGQTDDLNNLPSLIDHTVDFVMHDEDGVVDAVTGSGDIIGEEVDDRTPSGLWPSDHAGIALAIQVVKH